MVDPHMELALPPSPAEPDGSRILRNIRRPRHTHDASTDASGNPFPARQASSQYPTGTFSCAGGHSGPPLRGGFVSLGANANIDRIFVTPSGIGTRGGFVSGRGYSAVKQHQKQNFRNTERSAPTRRICFNIETSPTPNGRFAMPAELGTLNLRTLYRQCCLCCVTPLENSHDRWRVSSQPPRG